MANKYDVVIFLLYKVVFAASASVYESSRCWMDDVGGFSTTMMTNITNVCVQNNKLDFIILYFHKLFMSKID